MGYIDGLLSKNEKIIVHTRKHWIALIPPVAYTVFFLTVILAGALAVGNSAPPLRLPLLSVEIFPIIYMVFQYLKWWNEEYFVTNASIMTEKPVYNAADPIIVVYKNIPDYRYCWIAISKVGDPDGSYESYNWTYSATEGKMNFGLLYLKPGSYEVRLHLSRGSTVSKRYAFSVEEEQTKR